MSLPSLLFEWARAMKHAARERRATAVARWRLNCANSKKLVTTLEALEGRLLMAGGPPVVSLAFGEPGAIHLQVQDPDGPGLDFSLVNDIANYKLLTTGGDGTFGNGNEVDVSDRFSFAFVDNDGTNESIVVLLTLIPNDGERYQLQVDNITDRDGNALVYPVPAEFDAGEIANLPQVEGTSTGRNLFQLSTLSAGDTGMDATSAQNLANYTLLASGGDSGFGEGNEIDRSNLIAGIALEENFEDEYIHEFINITLAGVPDDGERYLLLVNNVTDQAGSPLVLPTSLEFEADDVLANPLPTIVAPQVNTGMIELFESDADLQSLLFDGIDDFVGTTLNIDQSSSSTGMSFEAWVFPTSTSAGRHHVISSENGGFDWSLLREGANWHIFNGTTSVNTGFAVDLNQWQHVAAVFTPGVGVEFYKNGQKFTTSAITFDTSDNNLAIGRSPNSTSEYFAGTIDEVRVWNGPRTRDELLANMFTSLTGGEANLAAYWRLDEDAGTVALDSSPNGRDGTLVGGVTRTDAAAPIDAAAETVQWIATGSGNWEDAANWSTGIVPSAGNRVIIGTPGITVTINSAVSVRSLHSDGDISLAASRSLRVLEDSRIDGTLTMASASTILIDTAGIEFDVAGPVALTSPRFTVSGASRLTIHQQSANLASATITVSEGGTVSLPALTSMTSSTIFLSTGSHVEMPVLTTFNSSGVNASASSLTLGGVTSITTGSFTVRDGGTVNLPALTTMQTLSLAGTTGGQFLAPLLASLTFTNSTVSIADAATSLTLPSLTTLSGGNYTARDNGTIVLPALTSLNNLTVTAREGGTVTLPAMTTLANSTVNIFGATSSFLTPVLSNFNLSRIFLTGGAVFAIPETITTYSSSGGAGINEQRTVFSVDGAGSRLDLSSLTSISAVFSGLGGLRQLLTVTNGGVIDLSGLTTITAGGSGVNGGGPFEFRTATSGDILLDSLVTIDGSGAGILLTDNAGTIALPAVQTIDLFNTTVANRTLNLPALTTSTSSTLTMTSGVINAPLLATFTNSTLNMSGAPAQFNHGPLATIDLSRFFLSGGATFALPTSITSYSSSGGHGTNEQRTIFSATGTGTLLDLSTLTSISGVFSGLGGLRQLVTASSGATIDLSGLTTLTAGGSGVNGGGPFEFRTASGAVIDLSSLVDINGSGAGVLLDTRAGGFTLNPGDLDFARTSILVGTVQNLAFNQLRISDTGTISGSGTLIGNLINDGGKVNSDTTDGHLIIDGDYTQTAAGEIIVTISGLEPGVGFDRVIITGHATLDGKFTTGLSGGYAPADGDEFQVVTFGSRTGEFTTYTGLDAGASTDFSPILSDIDLTLIAEFATGPSIVSAIVNLTDPLSIDVTFDEPVNRSTFVPGDVKVTGPAGLVTVQSVARLDSASLIYRITLADQVLEPGAYTLEIGPDVRDFVGNQMNQDGDTTNGEAVEDVFTFNFNLNVPNLAVSALTLEAAAAQFGQTIEVSWRVTNSGNMPAGGPWVDRVYLSADATIGGGDILLDSFTAPPLNPGEHYDVMRPVTIPLSALPEGSYFIIVRTDDAGVVGELNELDNIASAAIDLTSPPLPDLVITPTVAPASAQSGSSVHLEWNTSNTGTAAITGASTWVERVFLSTDATLSGGDIKLFERIVTGPLGIGATVAGAADVTLPIDRFGDDQHFIFVVDALDEIEEFTGESNNIASSEIDIALGPIADLKATVTSAPTLVVGDPAVITVSWTVENLGTGRGVDLAWKDAVILSADATPGGGDLVYRFDNPQSLDAGQSYSRSETITLPAGFSGQYHVFVVTDERGDVFENGLEANNTDEADAILDAMPIPYADLVVSSITVPAAAQSGQPMVVTFVVANQGIGLTSVGQWNDKLFLATDAAGTNRIAEFDVNHIGPVAVGGSYTRTFSATVPNGYAGDLFVVVQAGAEGGPFEFIFGNNNTSVSSAVPVTLSPSPDLTVTSITAPAIATDGEAVDIAWTVTNQGAAVAPGSWQDHVFLLSETDPDAPVVPLGTFTYQGPLGTGQSYTRTERFLVPNTTTGTFRVVVATNHDNVLFEDDTANNVVSDDALTTVSLRPRPDLVVDDVIAPADVDAGGTLAVQFIITNAGTAPTTPVKWRDAVYLSLDNEITNDDILIGELDNGSALLPGQSYSTSTASIVVPQRFRGSMFILISPDHTGKVDEFPSDNNLLAHPIFINPLPLADLVVSDVIVPAQAISGSTFDVTFSLDNLGSGPTNTATYAGQIWLTIDKNRPNPQAGDILLKTFAVNAALDVNEGLDITQSITLPANLQSGVYHITPWVDPFGALLEDTLAINTNPDDPDEIDNNNFKAKAIDIVGTEPDLEVTDMLTNVAAQGGDLISVTWTVENKGTGIARGRWVDRVYLSNMADPLDPAAHSLLLAEKFRDAPLEPNETYFQAASIRLSPSAQGQFIVVVTDDAQSGADEDSNIVDEVFEDNNSRAAAVTVTSLAADLVVTDVQFEPGLRSGEPTTIRYTVTNQGTSPVWSGTEFWKDFIWIGKTEQFERLRSSFLGTHVQAAPASLAPGESYDVAFQTTLPQGLDGDHYLYIHLDAHNDLLPLFFPLQSRILQTGWYPADSGVNDQLLDEFRRWAFEDPTNNLHSEPLAVDFFEPNLVLEEIRLLSPALSGRTVQVEYDVSNQGTRATRTGTYVDRFFLSRDPSLDTADLFIGSVARNQVVGIGGEYTASAALSLPEGIDGEFYIIGYTDSAAEKDRTGNYPSDIGFNQPGVMFEFLNPFIAFDMADLTRRQLARGDVFEFQNEGDNILAEPVNIALSPAPDLRVTNIIAPAAVLAGQTFDVTFTVSNQGTAAVPVGERNWSNLVYLSRDGFLDLKADRFLKESIHASGLSAGASVDVTVRVQAPFDLIGQFQLFAVADPVRVNSAIGKVYEGDNERNNDRAVTIEITQPPATDMVVDAVRFAPATLQTGELLHVEWDVTNTSGDDAQGQWSDAVFLSLDDQWDINDRPMGLATFSGTVASGESYTLSLNAFLPSVTPGSYFVIVRNDIFNQVFEGVAPGSGELNNENASVDTLAVTVQAIQLGVPFATTLSSGQDRLLAVTVPANETLRVRLQSSSGQSVHELFLRQDAAPTTSLYDADYEGGLNSNQVSILPSTQDGTVYILIRGQSEPAPNTPVTVTAELLPLSITAVDTDAGGDSRFVTTTIRGAKFDPAAVVTLVRPGFAELTPASFDVVDGTTIIAAFDFTGQPRGLYDVKVTNPDGASAIVPYRFLVERAIEPEATIGLGGPRFILAGDVGTYSVAVQGVSNVDTPYVFFQVGIPEMGQNLFVYGLDYLSFFSNVRGAPPAGGLEDVPFASLNPAVNTTGYVLTSGYVYDQHAAGFDGFTFNVETYPGLKAMGERNFEILRDRIYAARPDLAKAGVLDDGPEGLDTVQPGLYQIYKTFGAIPDFVTEQFVPFQFNVVAAATAMTRSEFIDHVLDEAEQLRQGVLADATASGALLALAADKDTWDAAFLASLEQGGVLRPEGAAPPVLENALIQSLMSTLATGELLGPAGAELRSGDLIAFFDALRLQYGHNETLEAPVAGMHPTSGNPIPALPPYEQFDLGLSASTQYQAFNVYVPWVPFDSRGRGLPADFQFTGITFDDPSQLANLDLRRFLEGDASLAGIASITGPFSAESAGFIPVEQALPYTINFQNDPAASSLVTEVRIVADIDERFDTRSFRLGDIRIGDINVEVPRDRGVFQADIDFLDTKGFVLRVSAGIDLASNEATWLIQAIDPITGQLVTDPGRGLLPPNNALGDGYGFVTYTIQLEDDAVTGDEVTAVARVIFNNAPSEETETLTQVVDAGAPTTLLTATQVSPGSANYNVAWDSSDDADGSGFKHVTIYASEDGGDFAIWRRQLADAKGSDVFVGRPGHAYQFLALATDLAGNREEPPLGVLAPDDGSGVNLGELPDLEGTAPDFGIPPVPTTDPSTNDLFTAAEAGDASAVPPVRPPEFDVVLRPFTGGAFATGIGQSHAGIGPMAIVEAPDGTFILSGGPARNQLFRLSENGGEVGAPFATLPHPIFNLAFDSAGRLWATTGGGPLLQLDPATGNVIGTFGEGLTIALAIEPGTDRIFVSSNGGVEVFDPSTGVFTRFSRDKDLRVGSLAFAPDGGLWAVTWPDRLSVVKFNERRRVETVLSFDSLIDSIAFGSAGSRLEGLLFVSHNTGQLTSTGAVEPDTSELTMVDTVTLRQVAIGQSGSRGDVVVTTSDGRILVSQSNQVDVLKPAERPLVVTTDPFDGAVVDPSLNTIALTFSEDMVTGDGSAAGSVLNTGNYSLSGTTSGPITISNIAYDAPTRTVTLTIQAPSGLSADGFTLTVSNAVESIDRLSLLQPFVLDFTVVSGNVAPSTAADQVATAEDTAIKFSVLLNDSDADNNINPTSVQVVGQPQHGSVVVDPVTGQITYTPALHYSGPDQFTYTIRDLSGAVSNEATVRLTVSPVADVPTVMAEVAKGDQDTAIPLAITASLVDADGSEALLIEIEGVPSGAVLSAGNLIGAGRFRLTPAELASLTITPPVGSDADFNLVVTAIATEQATGQAASQTVLLPVEVHGVTVDPVVVTQFMVNDGKAQRSTIHNLKVRFNQDVHIGNLLQDVRLIARKTGTAIALNPSRISYDAVAAQLTVDLDGLALADDHYLLKLSTAGITSVKARDIQLSDTDIRSGDGTVDLEFHRLETDWDGNDVVTMADGNLLSARYQSRRGDSRYDADFDVVKNGVIDQYDYAVWRRALNRSSDTYGPDIALSLVNDTGRSSSDRITFDPTTLGLLQDTGTLGTVLAGVDAAATANITSLVAAGSFTLSIANLQAINGGVPLTDGVHTLNITARDARNNATSIALSFTLDRQAPANPALPDLLAAFDTGASSSDNLTRLRNVDVSTIAESGALVRMEVDGVTQTQGYMNDSLLTLELSLTEGIRKITATAEDVAGNLSGMSPLLSITVDTTAPAIPAFDTTATANVTTSIDGATEPGVRVDLVELGQSTTASASGNFSFTAPLTLGLNKFTTIATDAAGNSSTFAAAIRRIGPETDAPTITAGLANDTGLIGDGITTDVTITGSVIDPSATPIAVFLAGLNGPPSIDVLGALSGGFFTLTPAILDALNGAPLADGSYTVSLLAQDAFLNASSQVTVSFTLDRSAFASPGAPDLTAASDLGVSSTDNLTSDNTPTFEITGAPNATIHVYIDDVLVGASPVIAGVATFTSGVLPDGLHTVTAEAVSTAGVASGRSPVLSITIDTAGPSQPTLTLDPSFDTPPLGDNSTSLEVVTLVGSTDANTTVRLYRGGDLSVPIAQTLSDGSGAFRFDGVSLAIGTNGFTAAAVDDAGNIATVARTITSTASDSRAPIVLAGLKNDTGRSSADRITFDPTITGAIDDASAITAFTASINGGPAASILAKLSGGVFTLTRTDLNTIIGGTLPDGTHTITFRATDAGGLQSSPTSFTFTLDTVRPARPATPDLADASDTGISDTDNITRLTSLDLLADAENDAILRLFVEGTLAGETIITAGSASFLVSSLSEGIQRISTRAEDVAGNQSLFSNLLLVTVDATAPSVPLFNLDSPSDTRPFGDNETALENIRIVGSADPGSLLELTNTGAEITAGSDGLFAFKRLTLPTLGDHLFTIVARDVAGNAATGQQTIKRVDFVDSDLLRPEVTLVVSSATNTLGGAVTLTVTTADNTGIASRELLINGSPVAIQPDGTATFAPAAPGLFTAIASAKDAAGNEGQASVEFSFFLDPVLSGDTTAPIAAFVDPFVTAVASEPGNIIGTASDANILKYTLEVSPKDQGTFEVIASGTASVVNGALGVFDPTVLNSGLYDVRLTVVDTSGNTSTAMKTFQAEGQIKAGHFSVSFEDASIAAAGFPISASRTYDTRNRFDAGDFGFGWNLSLNEIRISAASVLGDGGYTHLVREVSPGLYDATFSNTKDVTVHVRLPDGRVEKFILGVTAFRTNDPTPDPLAQTRLFFAPLPGSGTTSKLEAIADNLVNVTPAAFGQVTFNDRTTGELYNPTRFRLTTAAGTVLIIDQTAGVERITDLNGNTVTFTPDAITHSDGRGMTIARDGQGRITAITDPSGAQVKYEYDFYGDLVAVTDQEGNVTRLTYDNNHRLLEIHDPLGRRGSRNEYDDSGRLIAAVDALGHRVEYSNDIAGRQQVVEDRRGFKTVYIYDDRGNVLSETNALGETTTRTYDDRDNVLTVTNALGHTTFYGYDGRNNVTSVVDPLGNTTLYTYNDRNQLLTVTDPRGFTTANSYDDRGNLIASTDALGHTVTLTYDAKGRLATSKDQLGAVTTFGYNVFGDVVTIANPLGEVTTYGYDLLGRQLSVTRTRLDGAGVAHVMTESRTLDGRGRLLTQTNALGQTTRREYDAAGRLEMVISPAGQRTEIEYDARGGMSRIVAEDGSVREHERDADGNIIQTRLSSGEVFEWSFDALGRIEAQTTPLGTTQYLFDRAGRRIGVIDAAGNTTTMEYDAGHKFDPSVELSGSASLARMTAMVDSTGERIELAYDANGNVTAFTDADGRVTTAVYDALGRMTSMTLATGESVVSEYDAKGRLIGQESPIAASMVYEYDLLGRLTKVTDALGGVTTYTYDVAGNRLSLTDANGHVTRWEYDDGGRVISRTLPLGMTETFSYDSEGNVAAHTDFNGQMITYVYGDFARLLEKHLPGGSSTFYTYTEAGKIDTVTDAAGVTRHQYDAAGSLTRVDNADGTFIAYGYDAIGRLTSITSPGGTTTYTLDDAGRLATVSSPDGAVTRYTYGATTTTIQYPNGVTGTWLTDETGETADITYADAIGTILDRFTLAGSGPTQSTIVETGGRSVTYRYDANYRLIAEEITDPVNGNQTITYTYDAVGNRLTRTDGTGTTTYLYDANDRLISESGPAGATTYDYDANGNLIGKSRGGQTWTFTFDAESRLTQVASPTGSVVRYGYDFQGVRTSMEVDGVKTIYLVDKLRPHHDVLEERTDSGVITARYVYGLDLISQSRADGVTYYHTDGLGSTRFRTDETGAVTDRYTYDVFGNMIEQTGATDASHLYAGEQFDAETGLYYLRARYLDPSSGRFVSADPAAGNPTHPITFNRYAYANANPAAYTDPSGRVAMFLSDVLATVNAVTTIAGAITTAVNILRLFQAAEQNATTHAVLSVGVGPVVPGFNWRGFSWGASVGADFFYELSTGGLEMYFTFTNTFGGGLDPSIIAPSPIPSLYNSISVIGGVARGVDRNDQIPGWSTSTGFSGASFPSGAWFVGPAAAFTYTPKDTGGGFQTIEAGPNFALGPSFTFTVSAVYAVAASQAFEEIERFFSSMPQELRDLTSGARNFANDLLRQMQNLAQQTSVSTAEQWRSIARGINPDLALVP